MLRVVEWIAAAYEDIQNTHATWRFLRDDFSFSTIASTQAYTPAAVSINDHATWIEEDMRVYSSVADESFLDYCMWEDFKIAYMRGAHRTQEGRPSIISVKPSNNALTLWQLPDAVYTVLGEYYTVPDVLSGDSDSPVFPARFHMIIVWRALMFYGAYAAADEKYAHGQNEYRGLMMDLELDQLEEMVYGEPLA
jgi:hypothetical protein